MKVAIVHEWFVNYAGSEKVTEQLINIFPDADLFSVVDFLPKNERKFIKDKEVKTTFIQKLPFSKKKFRNYLPLMPIAVEQLDLSKYDLVISSSHAVAKGVITGPDQIHISYIHSPIRYAWDLQHQYLKESGLSKGIKGLITRTILHYMRLWDYRTASGVDHYLVNSGFIGRRVQKVYGRNSTIIYPPVDISAFTQEDNKENFYVTASRMVPYKKMDLIVEAFTNMPNRKLIVIGDGPDFDKIKAKAGSNVKLLGYRPFDDLRYHMQKAKAFVFAAEEDFGITPVEAQACGTPIIAYGKGGALETVNSLDSSTSPTGIFFEEQTTESIIRAVEKFEENYYRFDSSIIRENSLRFSPERFNKEILEFVKEKMDKKELTK